VLQEDSYVDDLLTSHNHLDQLKTSTANVKPAAPFKCCMASRSIHTIDRRVPDGLPKVHGDQGASKEDLVRSRNQPKSVLEELYRFRWLEQSSLAGHRGEQWDRLDVENPPSRHSRYSGRSLSSLPASYRNSSHSSRPGK